MSPSTPWPSLILSIERSIAQPLIRHNSITTLVRHPLTSTGGVLASYIQMGIPAEHLIAASVMSCPAALAISKLVYPELG